MNKKDFLSNDLFIYWRIHPTKELDRYWETFLNENENVKNQFYEAIEEFEKIRQTQNTFSEEETIVKKTLDAKIEKYKKRRLRWMYSSSAAAVALLVIASALFMKQKATDNLKREISIGTVMNNSNIQFLSGENIVSLGNNSVLDLSEKKNNAIIQDSLSQKEVKLKENQINKLIVPFGKRTSVILADGSRAYLNSGTEIDFPTTFTGSSREISVKGEIFIEVAHQSKPFIIHTPKSRINVFGTSFNVSSYTDEDKESVVLVSGSVQITSNNRSLTLKPNEMAEITDGNIQHKSIDVSEYISWKSGYMELNKTPLTDVLKKIGRYYNVEFQYKNDLNLIGQTCSGKLFLSENFDNVLDAFSKMTFLNYVKNNNNTISINKQPLN